MKVFYSLVAALPLAMSATLSQRSIICLEVGATATATWTNRDGQTCSFVGVVGSDYGTNSNGSGEYVQLCHQLNQR